MVGVKLQDGYKARDHCSILRFSNVFNKTSGHCLWPQVQADKKTIILMYFFCLTLSNNILNFKKHRAVT